MFIDLVLYCFVVFLLFLLIFIIIVEYLIKLAVHKNNFVSEIKSIDLKSIDLNMSMIITRIIICVPTISSSQYNLGLSI